MASNPPHPQQAANFHEFLSALLLQQANPPDKFGHQPRLYALTQLVGQGLQYDDDVVYAAAYLHDLGVFIGHRPEEPELLRAWDHVAYTVAKAPEILARCDFPAGKIPAVLAAIATHQPGDSPQSLEGIILRDADMLEQLGAVGILRTVAKVGRDTRFQSFSSAIAALTKSLDTLPPLLALPATRELAEPRIELLRRFLEGVQREAGENLH